MEHETRAAECSVVVCTRDRHTQLARCLESLIAANACDVLVVDNAPITSAEQIARRFGARYRVEPLPGLSRARNCGARESRGKLIAFVDDDCIADPAWLRNLTAVFDDSKVAAAGGRILPIELTQLITTADLGVVPARLHRKVPDWFEVLAFGSFIYGGNMAFRREVFETFQFDQRLGRGTPIGAREENRLLLDLVAKGHALVYEPNAVVYHPGATNESEARRRILDAYAAGSAFAALLWTEESEYRGRILRQLMRRRPRAGNHGATVEIDMVDVVRARIRGLASFARVSSWLRD